MTFPERKADSVITELISYNPANFDEIKSLVEDDLYEFMNDADRIHYLNILAERNQQEYEDHLKECTDPDNCSKNKGYERNAYYFSKNLLELGIQLNEDMFTTEEKQTAEEKIEKLMADLEEIKLSQTVIFQFIFEQMEEMKNHFYLGKRKWKELFIGKGIEMIIGGVVSETISKKVLSTFSDNIIPMLKGN